MATVIIPAPLRKYANNTERCHIEALNVSEMLVKMTCQFPELKKHLFNADGRTPPFINIFVNENDIRHLKNTETEIYENTIITIVPAIAGG